MEDKFTLMRKALFVALFFVFCVPLALAQDFKRGEIGGGYSGNWVDTQGAFSTDPNSDNRDLFHGFYVNGGYNFSRYIGVQVEVAHNRKTTDFSNTVFQPVHLEGKLTQGLVGVKFQDNAVDTKVRPFARGLIGVGHATANLRVTTSGTTFVDSSEDDNGFAAVLGGGIAFRLGPHADFVTSADYNPIRFSDNSAVGTGSEWTHNFRVGLGVNFRFGGK
jgi:hypothetical protein